MAGPLCAKCGTELHRSLREQGHEYHPLCAPATVFGEPGFNDGLPHDPYTESLREDITEIIKWADRNSTRSQQIELGASEVGYDCYRRLGYRIANIEPTGNETDPWPAIVGTAIHAWLEQAFQKFEEAHQLGRWATEMAVQPSASVRGHTDLYDAANFVTIDHKSASSEKMRLVRKGEIPESYIQQVMLYALGHIRAGRRVDRVALVFYPRSGWLTGIAVWSAPYDESIALKALDKVNRVGAGLIRLDITSNPDRWQQVPATPSKEDCAWCPWYKPLATVASDAGCPGK